ncbi:TIGR00730 family Rossman fold protein [Dyella nitratireducens]|uniref:Cytokinin riboside 5'-monophosphate phosphoribohydrolase n=1 Tax=Dyella nitratireducens TaxID=1849580 RepID=A0ABQ1FKX0_9GAMM|nr:TIGR00730 family Rossman fold protein [Dyella nitratireducens]GGA17855.1 cytokinin riboside 5'-monophosphate phosphoribohydrolase [Dyella nitratireducens]GLQ44735.1 cytokinin riboside 5'-monophosphate phosphoribohydrolase [Dyella nitratireducens]
MPQPTALCVYCGSQSGNNPVYIETAHAFGLELARRDITLVYGGGKVGLMGTVANAALSGGGKVIGVIPRQLVEREVAHKGLTDLVVVDTMHQRKTRMYELSDAFVALPGGFGTMDEMFEMLTWAQLGLHRYPCAFLDTQGYYGHLRNMMNHMVAEGFVAQERRDSVWFGDSTSELFAWMDQYHVDAVPRGVDASSIKA